MEGMWRSIALATAIFSCWCSFTPLGVVDAIVELDFPTSILVTDGIGNLNEGNKLRDQGKYDEAAMHYWRAVLMQEASNNAYATAEVFNSFLICFHTQNKVADGYMYVAAQSLGRGQQEMGKVYVKKALETDPTHQDAIMAWDELHVMGLLSPQEVQELEVTNAAAQTTGTVAEDNFDERSAESLYTAGSQHFSDREYEECADIFELSCQKSGRKLFPSCANAVYCRSMVLDWGFNGTGFEEDMKRIDYMSRLETEQYRTVDSDGKFDWSRSASVHPHMSLAYPLAESMLKRYVAESTAFMDEKNARYSSEFKLTPLPEGMPFDANKERPGFLEEAAQPNFKLKVGFVACGFNSKAVMYLSHDMFRFFDKTKYEVHIFSLGAPDNPMFIEHGMRGVDWRERVKANVDHFHDMEDLKSDHIALAEYVHDLKIHVLIEWDGYARQGERAQGLFALRPAPVQILHQEYLGTSGAQYVDYIFTDKVASPPHLEGLYTEKFMYMPNHFFSKGHAMQAEVREPTHDYTPAQYPYKLGTGSPQANRCMAPKGEGPETPTIVYCNFNKFLKNNPETVRSWVRILREVPGSMICLLENPQSGLPYLRKFVHEAAGTSARNTNDETFEPGDGDELNSRIHFLPWQANPFDHQMRNMDFCNVMLDSHPYNGHTVAQDALYGGVPIVTRSDGDEMASRVSTSANLVLGLDELNAYDGPRQYEDIAITLGNDLPKFQEIRTKLVDTALKRNPMHPYWDVPRYVKNFETGLEAAWDRYKEALPPDHITIKETKEASAGSYDDVLLANPPNGKKLGSHNSEEL